MRCVLQNQVVAALISVLWLLHCGSTVLHSSNWDSRFSGGAMLWTNVLERTAVNEVVLLFDRIEPRARRIVQNVYLCCTTVLHHSSRVSLLLCYYCTTFSVEICLYGGSSSSLCVEPRRMYEQVQNNNNIIKLCTEDKEENCCCKYITLMSNRRVPW